jgi:hypothetical protein
MDPSTLRAILDSVNDKDTQALIMSTLETPSIPASKVTAQPSNPISGQRRSSKTSLSSVRNLTKIPAKSTSMLDVHLSTSPSIAPDQPPKQRESPSHSSSHVKQPLHARSTSSLDVNNSVSPQKRPWTFLSKLRRSPSRSKVHIRRFICIKKTESRKKDRSSSG